MTLKKKPWPKFWLSHPKGMQTDNESFGDCSKFF